MANSCKQDVISVSDLLEYFERIDLHQDLMCEEITAKLIAILQKVSEMAAKQNESRSQLTETAIAKLCNLLDSCVTQTEAGRDISKMTSQSVVSVCSWCLRCLRNCCIQSPVNQTIIWDAGAMNSLKQLVILISATPSPKQEDVAVCLRCAVQLLGNLVSGRQDHQALMWENFFPHTLLSVFQCSDSKASHYLCMVINMCIQAPSATYTYQLWTCDDGYQLLEAVLTLCETESEQDFSLQLLQTLIGIPEFIPSVFNHLNPTSKVILLDILAAYLTQGDSNELITKEQIHQQRLSSQSMSTTHIEYLAEVFEVEADSVFRLVSEEQWSDIERQQKPQLVMRLLNTLCVSASHLQASRALQQRMSLLECSLDLLDRANKAGKKSKNAFTSSQTPEGGIAQTNPVFGFKRDLVRLIGNMCHHHTANQDKVRKLHGIPVLLEQCNIDDSNPFISQWAVFAIRNLCDGNEHNQAVIAEMTNKGVVSNDELQQYGFQAEMRDGRMYYKTTTKK